MSDILNISQGVSYDNSITKFEYHSYSPYINSFKNSDEIRIAIQNQDLYVLPTESFIYIEGIFTKLDGTVDTTAKLVNNGMAFLFEEIRYELNGVEIDRTRNMGATTTLKNFISLNGSESNMLLNSSWSPFKPITLTNGLFNFCLPLKGLLGFAEDYKKIIMNAKHEIILVRTRTDENSYLATATNMTFSITKMNWMVPHINVEDNVKLTLLRTVENNQPIQLTFRSWDMYEYPTLPISHQHNWTVKTSTQIEKPRYVIFAFQTDRKNQKDKDPSKFDHCQLLDIKVHLNSESFPYNDLNIAFDRDRFAILYDMYTKFQQSFYDRQCEPLLSRDEYKKLAPIIVINCQHQNESVKTGPVDVRVDFTTVADIPASTSAYCLLIHDRIVEYNPLTSEVRKLI